MSWFKRAMNRELTPRNKAGAYLAMLTCPCHFGVLLLLTGGTVVGTWLGRYSQPFYAVAAILFIYGVWTMCRSGTSCPISPSITGKTVVPDGKP
ncbi:MAG: hypothetical protein C0467_29610 [Planctomycetaceae bacterium]|nr:hypothetical protein [Planctomycetaceae bacterium]